MNREGCASPFATDEFALNPSSSTPCNVNLIGYIFWFGVLTFAKLATAVGISYDWWSRYRSRVGRVRRKIALQESQERRGIRLPIVPGLNLLQAFAFVALLVTTSEGICSAQNGCGLAMYSSKYVLFGMYVQLLLKQFIGLGRKMIPLARSKINEDTLAIAINSTDANNSNFPIIGDQLAKEDTALRLLSWIQAFCILFQWIFGVPVQLSQPRDNVYLWLRLSFGFQVRKSSIFRS